MVKISFILLIYSFTLFTLSALAQSEHIIEQINIENYSSDLLVHKGLSVIKEEKAHNISKANFTDCISITNQLYAGDQDKIIKSVSDIKKISVSRNPEQVLISADDQFAFIRCAMDNTIEILKIPELKIVKSLLIPMPKYFTFSHDEASLYVASFTDNLFPLNPPEDDCNTFIINLSGKSILTTIDVSSKDILFTDTIPIGFIRKILQPNNDSILYLIGEDVVEYNVIRKEISRRWTFSQNLFRTELDAKNERIFITSVSSQTDSLMVIDLKTNDVIKIPYYDNVDYNKQGFIGIDTLSNRIFVQGKFDSVEEVIVYDAISLCKLNPIKGADISNGNFIICPNLNSIFLSAGYPNYNMIELDYITLNQKLALQSPSTDFCKTILYNDKKQRLYTFKFGGQEDELAIINPPEKLDLIEYDLSTGQPFTYETTDSEFGCSYMRSLALTHDGKYVMITNSPENTVSIFELSPSNITVSNEISNLSIYPNPTSAIMEIRTNGIFKLDYNVKLYNILGTQVEELNIPKSITNFSMNLSKLPSGQYLIHFISMNQFYIKRIIKF
jgi:DNA-binding beta-propeller fold protein YncE